MAISEEEKNNIWSELKSPDLFEAFLSLKNEEELKMFFRDIMSERDLRELDMRWRVAKLLDEGKTFAQVEEITGVTSLTITKINRWLKEGCGGYKMMIERLKNKKNN